MSVKDHSPLLRIFYSPLRTLVWLIFAAMGSPMQRRNARAVPRRGAVLILSNHVSNFDPVLVQWSCPRLAHFMARRDLFDWRLLGSVIKWFRAFPVTQAAADTQAIRNAIDLLRRGRAVVVFPEGQLSPSGKLIPLLPGAHLLLRHEPLECLCVGLQGTDRLMPNPETRPRFGAGPIIANWGSPRVFDRTTSREEFLNWAESELKRLTGQE